MNNNYATDFPDVLSRSRGNSTRRFDRSSGFTYLIQHINQLSGITQKYAHKLRDKHLSRRNHAERFSGLGIDYLTLKNTAQDLKRFFFLLGKIHRAFKRGKLVSVSRNNADLAFKFFGYFFPACFESDFEK